MQMTQEINIHRSVSHKHVVGFHGFFEDTENVYVLLELCRRRVRSILTLKILILFSGHETSSILKLRLLYIIQVM